MYVGMYVHLEKINTQSPPSSAGLDYIYIYKSSPISVFSVLGAQKCEPLKTNICERTEPATI